MKTIFSIMLMIGFVGVANANSNLPGVVDGFYHTGYIPNGFDSNDHVQLVGEGVFSSSCYRPAGYEVNVNDAESKIEITPRAYEYDSGFCLMMVVNYSQTIDVGVLKAKSYKVVQKPSNIDMGQLDVRVATNSQPDDFLYAPISQAFAESKSKSNVKIKLAGEFTNSCQSFAGLPQVDVQSNVIVVQPVTEMDSSELCADGVFPFEKEVAVDNVKAGRYLIHVRSQNANSVNSFVDVK
ncbi:MAG: hypothetical protein AB8E15_01180 [Bdellovibrionales bacterium]